MMGSQRGNPSQLNRSGNAGQNALAVPPRPHVARNWAAALLVGLLLWGGAAARGAPAGDSRAGQPFTHAELEPLLTHLEDKGFGRDLLERVFYDPRLRRVERVVSLNAVNRDRETRYAQYLSPYALMRARRFRARYRHSLDRVEARYGVPQDIIVAVLLVESQFGTYPRRFRVLEVFTTLAVDATPEAVKRYHRRLRAAFPGLTRERVAARLRRKARWAREELEALLQMAGSRPDLLYELKGSHAGAFGLPQFLPTSYLRWAVDGDGDGRLDLDRRLDAMASIANYLRAHGWTDGADLAGKKNAVWAYNNSQRYVETIFAIHERLAAQRRARDGDKPAS